MAEDEGTPKDQIALGLGIFSLIAPCIPCVGSMLYMLAFAGAMVVGFQAHSEAKETGASTTLAKVGMGLSTLPIFGFILLIVAYIGLGILAAVLGSL